MEYTKYTVSVALVFRKQIYLSQRINTVNFPNKWQCPGGKLEENENPIDGALRELVEETGLAIEPIRIGYLIPVYGDPTTRTCYVYFVELHENEIPKRIEPEKMTEWKLVPFDDVLKLDLMPGITAGIVKLKEIFL